MKVTVVTHGPNLVLEALKDLKGVDLRVVDSFSDPLQALSALPAEGVLLTYRCPCLIPPEIYGAYPGGAFNIHPSLLPDFPGLNPWPDILASGRTVSGVTLHRLDTQPDSGEIIAQETFALDPSDTLATARRKADHTATLLVKEKICFLLSLAS